MSWVFIPLIVGAGLLVVATRMWAARARVAEVTRALEAVPEGTAATASSTPTSAMRGRAVVIEPTGGTFIDPINGRPVAFWELTVSAGDASARRTLYTESSGSSFLVADDTGHVRVTAARVDLRPSPGVVDIDGTPSAEVERYLHSLDAETVLRGTPDASGRDLRHAGAYSRSARHRYVLVDTKLSVIGHFVKGDGQGGAANLAAQVEDGEGLPAVVTEDSLSLVVKAQQERLRRHDSNTGRVLFVGLALLLVAAIKLLDYSG